MRIIIVGAGEVGFHIAERLTRENKEVVVIDVRQEALKRFIEQLDVQTVHGSGSSPKVLERAGIGAAEILLAVTDSDETNLVACVLSDLLAPGVIKLARVRNQDYLDSKGMSIKDKLNISTIINPAVEIVKSIEMQLNAPGAEDINDFADDRLKLVAFRIRENSAVAGLSLMQIAPMLKDVKVVVGAIVRKERLIIPHGGDTIEAGDLVYWVCQEQDLAAVGRIAGHRNEPVRNVMILGGDDIGYRLALRLESERSLHTKIVEKDPERCAFLAEQLGSTLVLQGDPTDQQLLLEENIGGMDAAIVLTEDDETNIIISLLARRLGARRAITRINKFAYMPLVSAIGLDNVVSARLSAINSILQFVRKGKVLSAVSLKGEAAEALEAVALENSDIVGKALKDLRFPRGSLVLAVIRGEEIIIPDGNTRIVPLDRVIIMATRDNVPKVEQQLTVKLSFF